MSVHQLHRVLEHLWPKLTLSDVLDFWNHLRLHAPRSQNPVHGSAVVPAELEINELEHFDLAEPAELRLDQVRERADLVAGRDDERHEEKQLHVFSPAECALVRKADDALDAVRSEEERLEGLHVGEALPEREERLAYRELTRVGWFPSAFVLLYIFFRDSLQLVNGQTHHVLSERPQNGLQKLLRVRVQTVLLPVVDLRVLQLFYEFHGPRVIHAAVRQISRPARLVSDVDALLSCGNFLSSPLKTTLGVVDDHTDEERGLSVYNFNFDPRVVPRSRTEFKALGAKRRECNPPGTKLGTGDSERALERGHNLELSATARDDEDVLHRAGPEREHPDWSGN